MHFLRFLWNLIWTSASRARRISGLLVGGLFFAGLILASFGYEILVDRSFLLLLVFVLVFVVYLLSVAIWRAYTLTRDQEPKIRVRAPESQHYPWTQDSSEPSLRTWFISVENISNSWLKNVSVRDVRFTNVRGHTALASGRYFRLSHEEHGGADHNFAVSFDLKGKGAEQKVFICRLDERNFEGRVEMLYASSPTNKPKNAINKGLFPHYLTLEVIGENLPRVAMKYVISITSEGRLQVTEDQGEA